VFFPPRQDALVINLSFLAAVCPVRLYTNNFAAGTLTQNSHKSNIYLTFYQFFSAGGSQMSNLCANRISCRNSAVSGCQPVRIDAGQPPSYAHRAILGGHDPVGCAFGGSDYHFLQLSLKLQLIVSLNISPRRTRRSRRVCRKYQHFRFVAFVRFVVIIALLKLSE